MSHHPPGVYGRIALASMRHRGLALFVLAVVTLLTGALGSQLTVDSDILSLMPASEPSTIALKKLDVEEGGVNVLTIAVQGADEAKRVQFMGDLEAALEALPEVDYVLWRLDPELTWQIGTLQVPVDDLTNLRDRLRAAILLGPSIANPFIAAKVLDLGPLTEKLTTAGQGLQLAGGEGRSRMIVRPKGSAHDIPFARRFMADVDATVARVDPAAHGVTIEWIGGAYRHNVEDYEGIVHDIGWISIGALVAVLTILAGAYRSPRVLLILFAPLLMANIWMMGVAYVTVGALNTFTSFVTAVLIGVGVDVGVHLYARYNELRHKGVHVDDAIVRAWDLVGGACTSAVLTSAAGFGSLALASFAGFRQLGWFLASGLVVTLGVTLVFSPILLHWLERDVGPAPVVRPRIRRARGRRRPASYRLAPMALLTIASITIVAGLLARRVQPEYDLSELRRAGLAYADLSPSEQALARDSYAPVVASFSSIEEMDAAYDHLEAAMKRAEPPPPPLARVVSIRTLLPADQAERVAILSEIAAMASDPNATYLPPQVRENLAKLAAQPIRVLTAADLPVPLQHVLGAKDGRHRLMIFPSGNMWDMREAEELATSLEKELPGVELAGEYLTLGVLYRVMRHDAPIIGIVAFVLVALLTWLDLRWLRDAAGAVAVLLAGLAWWGALLALSNTRISMVNFVGIPIVLGIGIDVMIHLIHRLKAEGPGRIVKALETTGFASALATSTTVVAFAALSLASSQGVRSLGLLVLLGESAVTVAGMIVVPLAFATTWRLTGRSPAALDLPDEPTNG